MEWCAGLCPSKGRAIGSIVALAHRITKGAHTNAYDVASISMQITGWCLVLTGAMAAVFLACEASAIPFLHGAGLAQADFELLLFSIVLGVPGVIAAVVGILFLRRHAIKQNSAAHRFPVVSTAIAGLTALIFIAAFVFSLMMRSYGFFWR